MIILTKKKYKELVKDTRKSFEMTIISRTEKFESRLRQLEFAVLKSGNEKILEKEVKNESRNFSRKSNRNKQRKE